MRRVNNRTTFLVALVLGLSGSALAQAPFPESWSTNFSRTYDFAPGSSLVVDNRVGNVVIEGVGGSSLDVRAKLTIRGADRKAITEGREAITLHSNLTPSGRLIRTAGNEPGRLQRWEAVVDYHIRVPRSCRIAVTTVMSDYIQIRDITGSVRTRNFSGRIDVAATGAPMSIDSTNGDIIVRLKGTPRGDSRLTTLNGTVQIFTRKELAFDWIAESVSGRVRVSPEITSEVNRPAANRNRWAATLNGGGSKIYSASMTGELILGPLADAPAEIRPGLDNTSSRTVASEPDSQEIIEIVSRLLLQRPGARQFAFKQNRVPDKLEFQTRLGNIVAVEVNEANVRTGAGEIIVGRALGHLEARTLGGPINIGETFASLRAETDAGDIMVNSANGGGYAKTGGGNIRIRRAGGALRLVSGGGDITVEEAAHDVTAHTKSGDVSVNVLAGTETLTLDLQTTGGNVIVTIPPGLKANVDATVVTSDTSIHSIDSTVGGLGIVRDMVGDRTRIRATGSLNGGGPRLKIVVEEGNIQLRQSGAR